MSAVTTFATLGQDTILLGTAAGKESPAYRNWILSLGPKGIKKNGLGINSPKRRKPLFYPTGAKDPTAGKHKGKDNEKIGARMIVGASALPNPFLLPFFLILFSLLLDSQYLFLSRSLR